MAEMALRQEEAAAQHQWALEQERMRHQEEIDRQNERMRREYNQRMAEQARAEERFRRREDEHRRRAQAEQAAYERRWNAEQAAREEQERRMMIEHERKLAAEKERAARLEQDRREQERREQLAREREAQRRENKLKLLRMTSPESLRSLLKLIRRKYELDMAIWADRKVRGPLRPDVEVRMEQSDAALFEILTIVGTWENNSHGTWKEHEWKLANEVKERLEADGKRIWAGNPPWEEN